MGKAKHPHNPDRPSPAAIKKALAKGDMKALGAALSVRQKLFCEEYAHDFNGSAAAIRAGYSPKWADRQAHILLKHEGVAAYIEHVIKTRADSKITAVDPDYVIGQVTSIINKEGARDGDRLRGLELLARYLGMFIDRTELTGKDGGAIEIENRKIEEEADSFVHTLKQLRERAEREKKDVTIV